MPQEKCAFAVSVQVQGNQVNIAYVQLFHYCNVFLGILPSPMDYAKVVEHYRANGIWRYCNDLQYASLHAG